MTTQNLKAVHENQYPPAPGGPLRTVVLPDLTTGIGVQMTAGGALAYGILFDIALPAAVLVDTLVIGFIIDTPSAGAIYTIQFGNARGYANAAAVTGAGGAAILAAMRQETRYEVATDAGGYPPVFLTAPIYFDALNDGIICRCYTVGGGETLRVSAICEQGFNR